MLAVDPSMTVLAGVQRLSVLIVDDDEDNRLLVHRALRGKVRRSVEAASSDDALEAIRRDAVDVILMDIELPGRDGAATTRMIRAAELALGRARTPVVALSGHDVEHAVARCAEGDIDDVLNKTLTPAGLLTAVARAARCAPWVLVATSHSIDAVDLSRASVSPNAYVRVVRTPAEANALISLQHVGALVVDAGSVSPLAFAAAGSSAPRVRRVLLAAAGADGSSVAQGFDEVVAREVVAPQAAASSSWGVELGFAPDPVIADLVQPYLADLHDEIERIREEVGRGDLARATRFGHNLKGNASGYGFARLGLLGARLEQAGKGGMHAGVEALVDDIARFCAEATRMLTRAR